MSDILEVVVNENPFEVVISDSQLEVLIQEDDFDINIGDPDFEISISSQEVEILTIAEQGPSGVGGTLPIHVGNTPPADTSLFWLDTN